MKFGKLLDISKVDFSLPSLDQRSLQVLHRVGEQASFEVYVGCPMWGNKAWVGKLYPKGTKAGDFLKHYSVAFNTIEMNTTHYRIPLPEQVLKWKMQAAEGFLFCPKIPQSISHASRIDQSNGPTKQFCDSIAIFEEHLGHSFLQLPEHFGPAKIGWLETFLRSFSNAIPLAIEFRHPGWFREGQLIREVRGLLEDTNTSTVITDVAGRRDVAHTSLTSSIAMVRFVGNGMVPSDFKRADEWIARMKAWKQEGLKRLYFFVHEPDDTFAPDMGSYIIEGLNKAFHLKLSIPGAALPGEQMDLF